MQTRDKNGKELPWDNLQPPDSGFKSILVDPSQPWDFYWGRRRNSGPALLLRVDHTVEIRDRELRGISIDVLRDGNASLVVITLNDESDGDVFEHFCRRLVSICSACTTEAEAIGNLLIEIERWHDFLGRVRHGLSQEQRMGIFGELTVLSELVDILEPVQAVNSWHGPKGAPQDFRLPSALIEVKTIAKGRSTVRISSEFQLDPPSRPQMFLRILELEHSPDGLSLFDKVRELRAKLSERSLVVFEENLDLLGLLQPERYVEDSWKVVNETVFDINDVFPSVRASRINAALSAVQYRLSFRSLSEFRCSSQSLLDTIKDSQDVG